MTATTARPDAVRLARDAVDFIEQVEGEARRRGAVVLGQNHWVIAACGRRFLARTIAREADLRAARDRTRTALERGEAGPALPPRDVLAAAEAAALAAGESRIHALHMVLAVLRGIGLETRDAAEADDRTEAPGGITHDDRMLATAPDAKEPGEADPAAPVVPVVPVAVPEMPRRRATRKAPRPPTPMLDQCGADWTVAAVRGELPPMVGRETEMALLIEGLCRPTKPNVLLVGEPGVGKSALVEGLAQRIAARTVPARLIDRPVIALNMAELTRDSRFYGAMEARLSTLIAEARAIGAILFIDEGHAMTGSGGREGTGDVASILKPVLARGDLSIISATTEDEYRRFIVPNGALERRFNVVHLAEPGRDDVRRMLAAHRNGLADSHGVVVEDEALDRILLRTAAMAPHRREPDRSRDVLDQVVARAIVSGAARVRAADVEQVVVAMSGAPEVSDAKLALLEHDLIRRGLLTVEDAGALVDRLSLAMSGLALQPRRPRAGVLVLRRAADRDGLALAETIAEHVFGGPEQVIAINVGGLTEASSLSGFLGTPQGYIGHGVTLPIHALAERPHSVLLLRGVDLAHDTFRTLLARAMRDGHLVDSQARRIGLTQAVVVLEARAPERAARTLGFAPTSPDGAAAGGSGRPGAGLGAAVVGEELADMCDLVVTTSDAAGAADRGWVADTLRRLAASYRQSGVELAWDAATESFLAARLDKASPRERERGVESQVGRAVRPVLGATHRPVHARVRAGDGGLVAETQAQGAGTPAGA